MFTIHADNVHESLPNAVQHLNSFGTQRDSRLGPVIKTAWPVTYVFHKPLERVIFWPEHDANPFAHFFEALWMLAGRNDLKFIEKYNPGLRACSDDGKTIYGAYGQRIMDDEFNQVHAVIQALKADKNDRRCVIQFWESTDDLNRIGKHFPATLSAVVGISDDGVLDMMVTNRSSDIIEGCHGRDAVLFGFLIEYIAATVGVPVGKLYHTSFNSHAYVEQFNKVKSLEKEYISQTKENPYQRLSPFPLRAAGTSLKEWDFDLTVFMAKGPVANFTDPFFTGVVTPMYYSHQAFVAGEYTTALEIIQHCKAEDWQVAVTEWVARRKLEAENFIV
jgi:thymidylate synthase